MKIVRGTKTTKTNKGIITAIAEIQCSNEYSIHVFKGTLSPNDILLKYSSPKSSRLRTPKHIHWAVDLLLKKTGDAKTTNLLLTELGNFWKQCSPLPNNTFLSINSLFNSIVSSSSLSMYACLDSYGEYPSDFLFVLMCLLAVQEKTNATYNGVNAHMFNDVLVELSKNNLDIYKIMSTSGYSGR